MSSSCGISDMPLHNGYKHPNVTTKIMHPFRFCASSWLSSLPWTFAANVVTIYGPVPCDSYMKGDDSI